jgi:predicted RND superfamily exporter protein
LGWPQDAVLQTLAPLILVVGVCDAVHLLSQRGPPGSTGRAARRGALQRAAAEVSGPCLVTTLTTAVAFLSFATSDLATFVRFGVISSIGVVLCLVLTFVLLPLLLMVLPPEAPRADRSSESWEAALLATSGWGRRYSRPILLASALLFAVCAFSWAAWLRVDTDGYEMYGEQSQVIRWIRFVEHELRRSDDLELEIALPVDAELFQVATLEGLREIAAAASAVRGLGRPTSVVDALARANRLFHDDDPDFERIGSSARINGELLELIEFQDPAFLAAWVSLDRRRARVSVEAEFQSFRQREGTLAALRMALAAAVPPGFQVQTTGAFSMGRDWVRDVQATQLRSFAAAAVLVFGLIWAYLRSLRWSLLAMLPTLLPVVAILGAMGAVGLSLDVGRAMIAAVIPGIGIDDTIHLLSRFRLEHAAGSEPAEAMDRAVRAVGRPVVTTSVALALGFLSLVTSSWQTVSSFGFFVSLGVLGALVADLLVLPALVYALEREAR